MSLNPFNYSTFVYLLIPSILLNSLTEMLQQTPTTPTLFCLSQIMGNDLIFFLSGKFVQFLSSSSLYWTHITTTHWHTIISRINLNLFFTLWSSETNIQQLKANSQTKKHKFRMSHNILQAITSNPIKLQEFIKKSSILSLVSGKTTIQEAKPKKAKMPRSWNNLNKKH